MNQKAYFTTIGSLFSFIAVVHFLRISLSWPFIVGNWLVPTWVSGLAVLIALFLAIQAFRFMRGGQKSTSNRQKAGENK